LNVDLHYQRHKKYMPLTLVSGNIKVYADIRFPGKGRQTTVGSSTMQRQFTAFSLAISSKTLEMRPALLYSDTESVVGFSVIPKYMTLNEP